MAIQLAASISARKCALRRAWARGMEHLADGIVQGAPQQLESGIGVLRGILGFARTLRVWLIAYGIGLPAIFLTNETAGMLFSSGSGRIVAYAFLGGVAVQVVLAFLSKPAMSYLYLGARLVPGELHRRLLGLAHAP
jgi:hypothetical protein